MLQKKLMYIHKAITVYVAVIIMAGTLGCEVIKGTSWVPDWINGEDVNLPSFSYSRSDELSEQSIKKVLIIPFSFKDGPERIPEMVTHTFAVELRKTKLFRLVTPSVKPLELIEAANVLWDSGLIDVDVLLNAKKRYDADGLLFGKITNYKPYIPLVLGVKLTMISTLSGNALWSIDGEFDSDQKEVVRSAKDYYKRYYSKDQSLYGWELMLISMNRYSRFVANMLMSTLVIED